VVWGVFEGPGGDPRLARGAVCVVAWLLCAWAVVGMLMRMLSGPRRDPRAFPFAAAQGGSFGSLLPVRTPAGATARGDLTRSELASLVPIGIVMLWIGVWPQFFTSRIEPTVGRSFTPSGRVVETAGPTVGRSFTPSGRAAKTAGRSSTRSGRAADGVELRPTVPVRDEAR
ncbi:MAG TPA: hypothetical protein VML55_13205, partial [Planctomycetaceae bacterium]|nr:hypothetical protein [Planctomycetaceae bacterium]